MYTIGLGEACRQINKLKDKKKTLKDKLYELEDKQFELEEEIDEVDQRIKKYYKIRDKHWQDERNLENSMYERSAL